MTRLVEITCPQCGDTCEKPSGAVNRARKNGAPVYCGKACAGLGRRKNKTKAQKVSEKAEYDRKYRASNRDMLREKKRKYHKESYDPEKAREWRQTEHRKQYHNDYCRRPECREKDRVRYAKRKYGDLYESSVILNQLQAEILSQSTRKEINLELGRCGKTQKRKRDYERSNSEEVEVGPLGNIGKLA